MRIPVLAAAVAAAAFTTGCGSKAPTIEPDQLPRVLKTFESKTEEIIAAFDNGEPLTADRAMHDLAKVHGSMNRVAKALLTPDQQKAMTQALGQHTEALEVVHAPMHTGVFPDDFDFEPIREKLLASIEAVRAAVPEEVVATLKEASEKRKEAMAAMAAKMEAVEDASEPADESDQGEPEAEPAEAADTTEEPATDAGAALPAPAVRVAVATRAPLCPSVMMYDRPSIEAAPERINRVASWMDGAPPGARWVQLVPTLHAVLKSDATIETYGEMSDRYRSWSAADNFTPATDDLADRFRDAFAAAIGQAVRRGLNVSILPHLDPARLSGDGAPEWRNFFRFTPDEVIGVGSYETLLIEPLANAVEAEASAATQIDFALSGEMGRSLFENPVAYRDLVGRLRERFDSNPRTANVQIGVALNWSQVAGQANASKVDHDAVNALFAYLDFVAVSCYAPVSVPPTPNDFARATDNFLAELRDAGGDLAPGAAFVFSEAGVGGGKLIRRGQAFPTPAEVAAKPYEGSGAPKVDPWSDAALAEFRQQYHAALCEYLRNDAGHTPPVERAFLWSEGPWDPQGVADDRFRNASIHGAIVAHNAKAGVSL